LENVEIQPKYLKHQVC